MSLTVRPLPVALGAQITGAELTRPLDDTAIRQINDAILVHHVVLFRGQPITGDQHVAFARRFGELHLVPEHLRPRRADGSGADAEVSMVTNQPSSGPARGLVGGAWHSDLAERPRSAAASLLRSVTLPRVGRKATS